MLQTQKSDDTTKCQMHEERLDGVALLRDSQ